MRYEVTVTQAAARPTAVVAAATTWTQFPALWKELLDEVWACLRAGGVHRGCPNVMLYLDDVPHVEIGVELRQPCPLTGRVIASSLPAGQAAVTVHRGPYAGPGGGPPGRARLVRRPGTAARPDRAGRSTGRTATIPPS